MGLAQVCGTLALLIFVTALSMRGGVRYESEYSCELSSAETECAWDVSDLRELATDEKARLVRMFEDNSTIKYSDMSNLDLSLPRKAKPTPLFYRLHELTTVRRAPKNPYMGTCWVKRGTSELFPSGWVPWILANTQFDSSAKVLSYLAGKVVVFAGDSTIREIYTELVSLMLNTTDKALVWPIKDKHADLVVRAKNITAMFYWTPTIQSLYKRLYATSSSPIIVGVGAWHVWHENITEYADTLQRIRRLSRPMSWIGIPYPVSLPGLRVPNRVRAWNKVTQDILQGSGVKFVDYYGITRTRAHESDGNIHYGYWSKSSPGNCTRAALLVGLGS